MSASDGYGGFGWLNSQNPTTDTDPCDVEFAEITVAPERIATLRARAIARFYFVDDNDALDQFGRDGVITAGARDQVEQLLVGPVTPFERKELTQLSGYLSR